MKCLRTTSLPELELRLYFIEYLTWIIYHVLKKYFTMLQWITTQNERMTIFAIQFIFFFPGLSKFAKLARSVTRSRSVLASQFSTNMPAVKESSRQSNLAHVS